MFIFVLMNSNPYEKKCLWCFVKCFVLKNPRDYKRSIFNSIADHRLLPPATKLGQGYIFTGVCDSVHGGGVCLSACWDTTPHQPPPPDKTPPGTRHPPAQSMLGQRAGGTHPTGMQSCSPLFFIGHAVSKYRGDFSSQKCQYGCL